MPSLLVLAVSLHAAESAPSAAASAAYPLEVYAAVGSNFAQNTRLADLGWTEAQFEAFIEGLRATYRGVPRPYDVQAQQLNERVGQRLQAIAAKEAQAKQDEFADPAKLDAYMKETAKRFKLQRSDSGIAFSLLSRGGGSRPGPDDFVVLTYQVAAADARTELPSLAVKQHRVKVGELLPGIAECVQMMTMGSSALLVLPPDLSYGEGEWPAGVPKGMPLILTLDLHEIITAP